MNKQRGAAMLIFVIFFLFASLALTYILAKGILADQQAQAVFTKSKQSYFTALSANEDMAYRYLNGMTPDATEVVRLANASATTTVTIDGTTGNYLILSDSELLSAQRSSIMELAVTTGISFNFGLQSGEGGIFMENSSGVNGDAYSNGPIEAQNSAVVNGNAVSAGPSGQIINVHATGSAFANSITGSQVDGDAYYQTINSTTVGGTSYPGSTDKPTTTLPIDDATILDWEAEAAAGGTYLGCSDPDDVYVIDSDITIGPLKIPCNLEIDKNNTDVTLAGPLWVEGDVNIKKGEVMVDASLAGKIIPIIAHNHSKSDSSRVIIENGADFTSASGDAYVMIISMNDDGENGGSDKAINIKNSALGELLLYAPHGILLMENSAELRQATAWEIHLQNSAFVNYEEGLLNPDFTSAPAGTFEIQSWDETY